MAYKRISLTYILILPVEDPVLKITQISRVFIHNKSTKINYKLNELYIAKPYQKSI